MSRFLSVLICVFIFVGCSKKEQIFVTDNKLLSVALQHTKKVDVVKNNNIEAVFIGTYLNHTSSFYDDINHNFLVGVYIPNDHFNDEKATYNVTFNDEILTLVELDPKELISTSIPLKNNWAKYYKVSIPKNHQSNITLSLEVENLHSVSLNFPVKN